MRNQWAKNKIMAIGLVSPIQVLTVAHCVVLTGRIDTEITRSRFPHKDQKIRKSAGGALGSVVRNQESGGSENSIALQIWIGNQFRPVRARLHGGGAELLSRMNIMGGTAYIG